MSGLKVPERVAIALSRSRRLVWCWQAVLKGL